MTILSPKQFFLRLRDAYDRWKWHRAFRYMRKALLEEEAREHAEVHRKFHPKAR